MNPRLSKWPLIALSVFLLPFESSAQQDETRITEEFFFNPLETVITAGRTEHSIDQAPAAMTIITSKEIRASGALTIPDLLRFLPGIDVVTISSSHSEVNARGLSQVPANKMLVMIDGRSVYFDYYGGVVWENLPIVMDQIDRIEIMRSPGSALYGANAFSGVINIITKVPSQMKGSELRLQYGEHSTLYTSFMHGLVRDRTSFRFAGGISKINSFDNSKDLSKRMVVGNFYLEHRFGPNTRFSIDSGFSDGFVKKIFIYNMTKSSATTSYFKLNANYGDFYIQAFWNRNDQNESTLSLVGLNEDIFSNTLDLELQNKYNFSMNNTLIYGASYRLNTIRSELMNKYCEQDLFAGYFQDEYRPIPEITLLAGARIDRHPLSGTNFSPRGSFIYSPTKKHTFRLTASKAFRNPSFQNSDLDYKAPYQLHVIGNLELEPEKITSYEFGYIFFPMERVKFKIDAFFLKFRDNIFLEEAKTIGDYLVISFSNQEHSKNLYGLETTVDFIPYSFLKISTNYSYQRLKSGYFVGAQQSPPRNKTNIKSLLSLPMGLSVSMSAGYVGPSTWIITGKQGGYELKTNKNHTRIDGKLSYLPDESGFELFLAAYNLLNSENREYPLAEQIKRLLTFGINWTY